MQGLYHYKLYGTFDDVNVWEFLAVQLDLGKYRLGWDTSTAQCREVDTDQDDGDTMVTPETTGGDNDSGDHTNNTMVASQNKSQAMVYYWEVQYPAFFSNRCRICLDVVIVFSPSLFS